MRGLGSNVFCGGSGMSIYRGDSGPTRRVARVVEKVLACVHDAHLCTSVALCDIVVAVA